MPRFLHEEILALKSRSSPDYAWWVIAGKLEELHEVNKDFPEALSDFIPMRLTTFLEVMLKSAFRQLIDSGSPYNELAGQLIRNSKIDFLIALNLQGQKLTLGDFVAHSMSFSDIEQVIANFKVLIPTFLSDLAKVHERWTEDFGLYPLQPIISDIEDVISKLKFLFTIRHIVTHEVPAVKPYQQEDLEPLIDAVSNFLAALEWLLIEKLQGHVPRTQLGMNIEAGGKLEAAEEALKELVDAISNRDDLDTELFKNSQSKWAEFADAEANLRGSLVEGGSMYPLVLATAKEELIQARLLQLQWWNNRGEGDV